MKEKQANKNIQGDEGQQKAFSPSSSNATAAQPLELTPVVAMEFQTFAVDIVTVAHEQKGRYLISLFIQIVFDCFQN